MHKTVNNLIQIKNEIQSKSFNQNQKTNIIAVSKTFSMRSILPLIDYGHNHYGENKVQEAVDKWTDIKKTKSNLSLHMIGKLQTNKVKHAVKLFDFIHSLDSVKLAKKIAIEQNKIKKNLKIFIQINIGKESQKNGIEIDDVNNFYKLCVKDFNLDIIGLMCLPPINVDPLNYFKKMKQIANELKLKELSMGMSSDYLTAIKYDSTHLRIGSKIFGERS